MLPKLINACLSTLLIWYCRPLHPIYTQALSAFQNIRDFADMRGQWMCFPHFLAAVAEELWVDP